MSRSLKYKLHEWLADHVKWVQYPNMRLESAQRRHWKYAMPWEQRLLIATVSIIVLAVSAFALVAMTLVAWAFLSSL